MRLYYDADSESLFWDEFNADPFTTDVTDEPRFRKAAKEQGLIEPEVISEVIANTPKGRTFADAITSSYKKWERKPSDLYPTPVDGTESLIPVLKAMKRPDGLPVKRIWEPACGDGRLARVLEWHGFEVVSTDLREYPGYGEGGLDFLSEHPKAKWGWDIGEIDAIVTNPPFSLAEEFIRRALSMTPNVAMLLKQTYWNVGGRSAGLWVDHMPDMELKLTWRLAFLAKERGNSPLMDCMWNVWLGENAALPVGERMCVTEPLPRRKYPGYSGIGAKAAMQVLEGELDELTKALSDVTYYGCHLVQTQDMSQ
jgi:hypothetical protein